MPFPVPFSIDGLAAAMGQLSGRRIELVKVDPPRHTDLRTACGLRAHWDETTYILYRTRPTENQMRHTILHELAHEWLGHGVTAEAESRRTPLPGELLTELAAPINPGAVLQSLTTFRRAEEREAELAALLIKDIVRPLPVGPDSISVVDASLTHPFAPVLWRGAV
ncbi:ImmA/IrrE family metallo-endopeptidase [Streptacidiphilus sp. EB103A]|uniref:ImmA/IrrE family metallo-endopeptidase n=1 Tax=Streptacidiphilus sp. EB103A TaxID=3156275 RepID=UPI0035177822